METQMRDFSQNGEQKIILEYFKNYEHLTFCSIGENDGETLSNVRALALTGRACGIFIEPSPVPYRKLKALYEKEKKGCFYTYNVAVGNVNGSAILHDSGSLLKKGDTGLVSTLVAEEKKRFESVLSYEEVEVKVYRWKTLLNRLSIKKFDFVSIDAESMDWDILEQMDVSEVKCLCIEWNGHQYLKDKFSQKMEGFKIIYTSGENLIFAR